MLVVTLMGIEIAVDAALQGDRKLFEEAILMGGYISDRKVVSRMVEELIKQLSKNNAILILKLYYSVFSNKRDELRIVIKYHISMEKSKS